MRRVSRRECENVSEWHDLGSLDELVRAGRLVARVGGREVGAVLDPLARQPVGFRNRCPHHGGPLCLGSIEQRIEGAPGRYELAGSRVLRCPWHGWEFDLTTGKSWCDPTRVRVKNYAVTVEPGAKVVEGPYKVETFQVSVEDDYVVVML